MTAKIDWYREVLELEPNSKVFFPLARLLVEDGQADEAMALLGKGLDRHPEFLEARLYLIELLYTHGRRDECNAQVGQLSKMFASYAGFWQAWAACLASDEGQEDTASIIRFLAAHFVSGPLNLHEVLNRGLESILQDRQGANAGQLPVAEAPAQARAASAADGAAEFAAHTDEMLEDLDAELGDATVQENIGAPEAAMTVEDSVADMAPEVEEAAQPEPALAEAVQEAAMTAEDPVADMAPEVEEAAQSEPALAEAVQEAAMTVEDPVADMAPEVEAVKPGEVISADAALKAEADLLAGMELPKTVAKPETESAPGQADDLDDFGGEEPFSLRTRSMAEVLAEQGDIQGALDIYQELAAAATSPDEVEDINRRMATLNAKLTAPSSQNFSEGDVEAAARSKEKLIGMLEALAERVEARAAG